MRTPILRSLEQKITRCRGCEGESFWHREFSSGDWVGGDEHYIQCKSCDTQVGNNKCETLQQAVEIWEKVMSHNPTPEPGHE